MCFSRNVRASTGLRAALGSKNAARRRHRAAGRAPTEASCPAVAEFRFRPGSAFDHANPPPGWILEHAGSKRRRPASMRTRWSPSSPRGLSPAAVEPSLEAPSSHTCCCYHGVPQLTRCAELGSCSTRAAVRCRSRARLGASLLAHMFAIRAFGAARGSLSPSCPERDRSVERRVLFALWRIGGPCCRRTRRPAVLVHPPRGDGRVDLPLKTLLPSASASGFARATAPARLATVLFALAHLAIRSVALLA